MGYEDHEIKQLKKPQILVVLSDEICQLNLSIP